MQGIRVFAAMLVALVICGTGIAFAAEDSSPEEAPSTDTLLSASLEEEPGVEMASKRTATSETFLLPNGMLATRIFEAPINYQNAEGEWKPIGEGLEEEAGGGFTNGPNDFDLQLPEKLGAAPVRLSVDGEWVSTELAGAETEEAELAGDVASYEAAGGGTTFELSPLVNGVKENIEIASASEPSAFHFDLQLSEGLTPSIAEDGSVEIRDSSEEPLATMPAPFMTDSSPGQPEVSHEVRYELEPKADGGWMLAVVADREWLSQPERVFPVDLDPTVTTRSPSLDCTFGGKSGQSGYNSCASAGAKELYALYRPNLSSSLDEWNRAALRFDLSSIPQLSYVIAAKFAIYSPSAALNTSGIDAFRATKSWTNALNWKAYNGGYLWTTQGGDFTSEGSTIYADERGSQAGWWEFAGQSMKELVQRWTLKEISNQGLIVKLSDDKTRECGPSSCTERRVAFNSSAFPDSNLRPYMEVLSYAPASSSSKVTSPSDGTVTAKRLKLKAGWSAQGVTGVSFQYKVADADGVFRKKYSTIPSNLAQNAKGEAVTWPLAVGGSKASEPVYFDALQASESDDLPINAQRKVLVRALLEGTPEGAGYTKGAVAIVEPRIGGTRDATASVGPGTVNLLTGNFTVSRADVSVTVFSSSLEFARSFSSRDPAHGGNTSVLGPGWQPSATVEAAGGAEWRSVREVVPTAEEEELGIGPYALLTDLEGYEYAFEKSGETFISPPEASGWILSRLDSTHLAFTDPDGNRTVFENSSGGSEYLPVSVSQTGGSGVNKTQMVYEIIGGKRRLKMIIAPSHPEVVCNESNAEGTPGCRALKFTYQGARTWGAPDSYGDRLVTITYYGPSSSNSNSHWTVAGYNYNAEGRMTEAWDPRISPALKETYTYNSTGMLQTITPPGEEPWTLEYQPKESESDPQTGRLVAVKRPSLLASPSVAQTTIAYGAPVSGSGAPYDMSGSAVAQWGQQDLPTDATAIFPPDQVPASPPSSYSRATVYYMDAEGMLVNTATPSGAGTSAASITTTEPDEHGNVVRELSAQNRLRALAAGAGSVAKSHDLETKRNYSADGTEMLEEWGPLHEVRLESGSTVQARAHKTVEYDKGAPAPPSGTPKPHLPTRETVGASIAGQGVDADQHVTESKYDWNLRLPTETIVDPEGLNLRTVTVYNTTTGLVAETRQPAKPEGGDAHATKIIRYTPKENSLDSTCGFKPGWASLPCRIKPISQPGTPGQPDLLVTRNNAYSPLGQPIEIIQSPGGTGENSRVTSISYDASGRETSRLQTGGGSMLPKIETLYNSSTGAPRQTRFACQSGCESFDSQATTTTYDTLGRPTEYEDADGNLSSTSYDLLGRPVTSSDGKGIQTRTYDPTSGLLVQLEDSAAGTFTASYDADGNLTEQGLPNGLVAKTTYDETGAPIHLSYEKKTFCSVNCTWLDFGAERSIIGQILAQTSLASSQQYSYDKAGRLTLVKDTPQGGGCTTRTYSYDKDSNRTALITRAPGIGGACDTTSAGTTQSYSYDAADRLINSGISYDNFGRITSLPGNFAGGSTLATSYYSNDLVASQSQAGITNSYELDAALRQRTRSQAGEAGSISQIYHYADVSDSPAWTETSAGWTRYIDGIDGGLSAIQDSAKGAVLQLPNLHGDIVATASPDPQISNVISAFEFDEFGNPEQAGTPTFGWLGSKARRTELAAGVIQMGVRSYVPALGRFITVDPIQGGSASAYDYADADPVNNFDLEGTCAHRRCRKHSSRARGQRVGTGRITRSGGHGSLMTKRIERSLNASTPFAFTKSCVDSDAYSPKLRVAAKVAGGICIPKLIIPVHSIGGAQAAYQAALLYCMEANMAPPSGGLGAILGLVSASSWCGKGGHAWAYVQVT
jgi:RHS repeat-associated protein